MARKHVVEYYLTVQNQYLEMLSNMKDFNELVQEGKITEEEYNQQAAEVELLKSNYERLSYIMLLLNKPKRKDAKEDKVTLSWYNSLSGASKEALLNENADCLADLKELIKKGQIGKKDE